MHVGFGPWLLEGVAGREEGGRRVGRRVCSALERMDCWVVGQRQSLAWGVSFMEDSNDIPG